MGKTIVHMVGQAHLDPVWLWTWTEGRAEAVATSTSAVDRLRECPEFEFTRGEAQVYAWIEQESPALLGRIRELIAEGRWHVVNGMVVQPDMNMPQGESLVRHFLLGKGIMRHTLGVDPTVAYCVDSFGHAATLPQIFVKCGCTYYVFMRPGPHEKELPAETFKWQAPDGSAVLAYRIPASYATRDDVDLGEHIERAVQARPDGFERTMCFFGVGNHGGGPTRRQIEDVRRIGRERGDLDVRFSGPAAYFDAIAPEARRLPRVQDELQMHAVGCYSANSNLKRAHRLAECSLLIGERMAVLAQVWADQPSPRDRLRGLWRDVCFCEFHDILCGCSIKDAADEAIMMLGRAIQGGREIADDAGRAIAAQVDTSGPGGSVVVFNPFPSPGGTYVEYEPWTGWESWSEGGWGLVDDDGRPVAYQQVATREALSNPRSSLTRVVFRAQLPPLGYRVYRFAPRSPQPEFHQGCRAGARSLENDLLQVAFDGQTGAISSCRDKATGIEFVGPGQWNVPLILEDRSDTWSHGIRRFEEAGRGVVGAFDAPEFRVVDTGPVQASVLVERRCEASTWLQQVILRQGEPALLLRNWLFWHGRWRVIKLAFDVRTDEPTAVHDVPFGWIERPCDGAEVPTQMWFDVSGASLEDPSARLGLAVMDGGKYGCDVSGSTMRLTVLRCPPYAYHIPHVPDPERRHDWIDQGQHEFTLMVLPHVGDWRDHRVVARARELNLMPLLITTHGHPGELPGHRSAARLSTDEIEMTALKPAEDGDGFTMRLADRHGRGGAGTLTWLGEAWPVSLAPFEVQTVRLQRREGRWFCNLCDMLERPAVERARH